MFSTDVRRVSKQKYLCVYMIYADMLPYVHTHMNFSYLAASAISLKDVISHLWIFEWYIDSVSTLENNAQIYETRPLTISEESEVHMYFFCFVLFF